MIKSFSKQIEHCAFSAASCLAARVMVMERDHDVALDLRFEGRDSNSNCSGNRVFRFLGLVRTPVKSVLMLSK
jgi:hypothetical protein